MSEGQNIMREASAGDGERRSLKDVLIERFERRSAVICVMGLGYVGLPLSMLFSVRGNFRVIGYDVDRDHVTSLMAGKSSICDVSSSELQEALSAGRFAPTASVSDIVDADVYIICVPTPLAKSRQPDLSYIQSALTILESFWTSGKMVILESTTYPGTTEEMFLPALSRNGLRPDRDFLLAFSPERVDPGNREYPMYTVPKVVGGITGDSTEAASVLYGTVFTKVHQVSSAKVAELAKLLENTFRNVNIAFVNEFAQICSTLNVDVWEVIEAAKTKPFGFMPFYPGAGIGGHCIPLDPQYLVYRTRLAGYEPRLVALADQINQEMPRFVCGKAVEKLNSQKKPVNGSNVLIIGVSYKPNVPDTRESPAIWIIDYLRKMGAHVRYHDPYVPTLRVGDAEMFSVELTASLLDTSDLVIIVTPHTNLDFSLLKQYESKTLDPSNGLRRSAAL